MMRPTLLLALAVTMVLAGCLDADEPSGSTPLGPSSTMPPGGHAVPIHIVTWEGYSRIGVASDLPAHWDPPERYTEALWKEGFVLHVSEHVQALEFSIEWTGAEGSSILFMAHSPHDQGVRMREYQTEDTGSTERSMCFRVPPEDLAEIPEGHWHPMFHPTPAGAQIEATVTVRALGGHIEILDHPHGHDPFVPDEVYGPLVAYANPDQHAPCDGELTA